MRSRSLRISRVHKPFLISWIGRSRDTVSDGDINELGQLGERQTTCGTSRGEREGVPGAQWDAVESTKRILDEGRLHREMKGTPIVGGEAGKKPRRADENASQSRPRPGAWPNTVAAAQTTPAPSSPPSRNSHLSPIGCGPRDVPLSRRQRAVRAALVSARPVLGVCLKNWQAPAQPLNLIFSRHHAQTAPNEPNRCSQLCAIRRPQAHRPRHPQDMVRRRAALCCRLR